MTNDKMPLTLTMDGMEKFRVTNDAEGPIDRVYLQEDGFDIGLAM